MKLRALGFVSLLVAACAAKGGGSPAANDAGERNDVADAADARDERSLRDARPDSAPDSGSDAVADAGLDTRSVPDSAVDAAADSAPTPDSGTDGGGDAGRRDGGGPAECRTDSDCVPAMCCHPTACAPVTRRPDCEAVFCTAVCVPDTLDCGQGRCGCVGGVCEAIFF